jgi:hypothetical protein
MLKEAEGQEASAPKRKRKAKKRKPVKAAK